MSNSQSGNSHPDADIHPIATGPAKKVVDAHKDEQPLKMYAGWFCPFVQRAWMVLEEKKIPYQYIEVNPYHKPESLLKLNPRGLVPTMQYDNKPVYESTVICELLEDAYPDHTPKLLPEDLYDRARMRIWVDWVSSRLIPSFHRFLQYQPENKNQEDPGLDEKRQEFLNYLKAFTREMDTEGPYFMGKEPKLIDFVIAPWAIRTWIFDEFKEGSGIPKSGQWNPDNEIWERWNKWYEAISSRDSVKNTTSEQEHYMPIYQRYADDKAQSEMAKSVRAGRGTV